MKNQFYNYILGLQDEITSKLEEVDGNAKFQEDLWERPEGGGGRTRVLEYGDVFEKAGVNVSAIKGSLPESLQKQFKVNEGDFFACGLSIVIHPKNPFIPTIHANWRYFEMYNSKGEIVTSWFGGGQDLTPYYFFKEDVIHFHKNCKKVCDKYSPDFYTEFKESCDNYFWNTHRNESRGVGGLFFDYLKETNDFSIKDRFNFVCEVGNNFLHSYLPIVNARKNSPFSKDNRRWQEIRRGRYVEFNLVHDRGTLFGLKTNGRIESILMSLPPKVQWKYNYLPIKGSKEAELLDVLSKPIDWLKFE
jgi:coproporphyrinogen III oxidase